jgi:hypothetical protein
MTTLNEVNLTFTEDHDARLKRVIRKYGQPVTDIEVMRPFKDSNWKVYFYLKDGTEVVELTESFSTQMFAGRFAKKQKVKLEELQETMFSPTGGFIEE